MSREGSREVATKLGPQPNRWLTLVPAIGLLALAALFLREWWLVGYVGDPETIAAYRFGSEAMVSHGGAKYRSAGAYATSALHVTGLCALLAGVFFAASRLRSWRAAISAYVLLAIAFAVTQVVPNAL